MHPLKKVVKYAANRDHSDLLVFNEDRKQVGRDEGWQGQCNMTVGQEMVKGLDNSAAGRAGQAGGTQGCTIFSTLSVVGTNVACAAAWMCNHSTWYPASFAYCLRRWHLWCGVVTCLPI